MPISIAVHGLLSADLPVSPPLPLQARSNEWDDVPPGRIAAPLLLCLDSLQRNIATKAHFISFYQYPLEPNWRLLHQMFPTFPQCINYAYSSPPLLSKTQGKLATGEGLSAQVAHGLSSQDRV